MYAYDNNIFYDLFSDKWECSRVLEHEIIAKTNSISFNSSNFISQPNTRYYPLWFVRANYLSVPRGHTHPA